MPSRLVAQSVDKEAATRARRTATGGEAACGWRCSSPYDDQSQNHAREATMNPTSASSRRLSLGALALCLCAAIPALAGAQAATQSKLNVEGNKKLLAEAKINPDSAAAIAVTKMPGTTPSTAKIERSGKWLAYSVSLLKAGSKGIDRVWVDANTGSVMRTKHYGGVSGRVRHSHQAHEAKEAAQ